jgi:hypothetical protein
VSSKRDVEHPANGLLIPRGMTAAEFTRQTGGAAVPEVPADQPPPADMPPVPVMVLDSLADDAETVCTMRNCGEMAPYGVALVGESHLLDAIRSLLEDDLVEVELELSLLVSVCSSVPSPSERDR